MCGTASKPVLNGGSMMRCNLSFVSVPLLVGEYRRPRFSVSLFDICQSSWAYRSYSHSRKFLVASRPPRCVPLYWSGTPCRNSVRLLNVNEPCPGIGEKTSEFTFVAPATAAIGIEASLTGHLVFATLHTNSAPESIIRLLDMGMDPFNFADALLGVLAQRLAKRLCKCKQAYTPSGEEMKQILDEQLMSAWQQRARRATRLGHPHLAAIVEVGEHERRPYVVYERGEFEKARDAYVSIPRQSKYFEEAMNELAWTAIKVKDFRAAYRALDLMLGYLVGAAETNPCDKCSGDRC